MKPWLWLVLLAATIAGAVIYLKVKGPSTPATGTDVAAPTDTPPGENSPPNPEPQGQPGLESSSGPLGGEITPRQQNSAPQPLPQYNQSPPLNPAPFNPNDPSAFPPPPTYPTPDPNSPPPPPIDPPSYVPPPDNNFDNVEPPPNSYVDPVQPYNPDFDGNPPPPPPPPAVDDEF